MVMQDFSWWSHFPTKIWPWREVEKWESSPKGWGIKESYKDKTCWSMFSYFLGIIHREWKADEVGIKEDNLKSKFLKQVRQDGTQSTSGRISLQQSEWDKLPCKWRERKGSHKWKLSLVLEKWKHSHLMASSFSIKYNVKSPGENEKV